MAAAQNVVHIIDKGALTAVFKFDAHQTGAAGQIRVLFLDNFSRSPPDIIQMSNPVANLKK